MEEYDYTSNKNAIYPLIATTPRINGNNNYQQSENKESNENDELLYNLHYYCGDEVVLDIMDEIAKELDSDIIISTMTDCNISWNNNTKITNKFDMESNKKQNKKSKRKKCKKKNKQCIHDGIGYDPNPNLRAKGHIKISKELTEIIIPSIIKEKISNIYNWMDRWTAMLIHNECDHHQYIEHEIRILNYGFHDKITNKMLYCIGIKQDILSKSARGYQWSLRDKLFTDIDIEREYKIAIHKLPKSPRLTLKSVTTDIYYKNKLENMLNTEEKHNYYLLQNTSWHKLKVYKRKNNKERMVLYITKPEFMNKLRVFMDSNKEQIELIPILMFNENTNHCWTEFIWIVRIAEGIHIGVSFKYNEQNEEFKVSGIHLDKQYIHRQHELIAVDHECHCLDHFTSIINNLEIGNPDNDRNRMNYYKQHCEQQTVELEQQKEAFKQQTITFEQQTSAFKQILNEKTVELERGRVECEQIRAKLEEERIVFERQTIELMQCKQYIHSLEAQMVQTLNMSTMTNQNSIQYSLTNNTQSLQTTPRSQISGYYNTSAQSTGYPTYSRNGY